jgi:hypothetical protein
MFGGQLGGAEGSHFQVTNVSRQAVAGPVKTKAPGRPLRSMGLIYDQLARAIGQECAGIGGQEVEAGRVL